MVWFGLVFGFSRQGFSVALEPVLGLPLVDQADLKLREIPLPLLPKCWDERRAPPSPSSFGLLLMGFDLV